MRTFIICLIGSIGPSVMAGCSNESAPGRPALADTADEFAYDCLLAPPTATAFASDEAYRELVDVVSAVGFTADDSQSPRLLTPLPETTLSATQPPTISVSTDAASPAPSTAAARIDRRPRPLTRLRSSWRRLWKEIAPIGTAWAHCGATSGELFLVHLAPEGGDTPAYTALMSLASFRPRADIWKRTLGPFVGKSVRLTLARAVYSAGKIQRGPFVSSTGPTFRVGE